ncbi:MAG: hypothetical protein GYB31_13290 [Bacteroidetes bacterium]|nr:hypothetical protein [Bacteroidota bacterium]
MSNQETEISQPNEKSAIIELTVASRKYFREVRKNWKLIGLIVLACVIVSILRAKFTKATFQADLSFMVNEDEGGKLSGLSTVLEDIGLGIGGAASSEYNLEKIMELMRSRRILEASLLERGEVNGREDIFANHIIEIYELHKEWDRNKPRLKGLIFTHDSIPLLTVQENTGLQVLYKMLLGSKGEPPLLKSEILDMPAILELTLTTRNEDLSYKLLKAIYSKLSDFYIEKTVEKQRETYQLVSHEADSIRDVLADKEFQLATFEDQNQSLVTKRSQLRKDRLEREILILSAMYGEAAANEEVAKFTLRKRTPFIQSIDIPRPPLKRIKPSLSSSFVKGLLAGLILGVVFVIGRLVYRETMKMIPQDAPAK